MKRKIIYDRISTVLSERKESKTLRSLKGDFEGVDFFSNDYLGFARSAELAQKIRQASLKSALPLGATGSRLLSGDSRFYQEVEKRIAEVFMGENALLFNSGYNANLGVLSCLPTRSDVVFYDEKSHACIKDGVRLSHAKYFSFRHNDIAALEQKIVQNPSDGQIFIVVESIYSMDGDEAPLSEILALVSKYQAFLIVDEAHSTAVMGAKGEGFCVQKGLEKHVDIRIQTFGKGLGAHGAAVICSTPMKEYLINHCRPFIYTTALSPHAILHIDLALQHMIEAVSVRNDLNSKIGYFKAKVSTVSWKSFQVLDSTSAIQGVVIGDQIKALNVSENLRESGVIALPILSPTVPSGTERLRICLHTFNTHQEIDLLISLLEKQDQIG
jgi:8-amino-7-oxononanoate synthase